jgi:hypothetical protein
VRGLSNRMSRLEARYSPAAMLASVSDGELGEAFKDTCEVLSAAGLEPPFGWDAPLPDVIRWLERETREKQPWLN